MARAKEIEAGAVGHGRGDCDDAVVLFGEIGEGVGEDFGIGGGAVGSLAGFRIVGAKAVEFLLPFECRLKATSLLREHVQQDRVVDGLEEFECLDKERDVVAIDGAEVLQAKFLKHHGGPKKAFGGFFSAADDFGGGLTADALDELRGLVVQVLVALVGDNAMQVTGHGAHIAVDGPLIVCLLYTSSGAGGVGKSAIAGIVLRAISAKFANLSLLDSLSFIVE